MKSVHLVISDLFLPQDIAAKACRGLRLPALEKILSRGSSAQQTLPLENLLCQLFDVKYEDALPIAPISASFDGLDEGCWLRADPVCLHLQREQLLMSGVRVDKNEAEVLCNALNMHFADQGVVFFAPHPQRWYVRVDKLPEIKTMPMSQVMGRDIRKLLPAGLDASYWHQIFNEIQMLLFSHPINIERESKGLSPINSVWFWGAGCSEYVELNKNYQTVCADEILAEIFAKSANIPFTAWSSCMSEADIDGSQLLVWHGLREALLVGDLIAWREALQSFEMGYAKPLWKALCTGRINQLIVDIVGGVNPQRICLSSRDRWTFWRGVKPLEYYSVA